MKEGGRDEVLVHVILWDTVLEDSLDQLRSMTLVGQPTSADGGKVMTLNPSNQACAADGAFDESADSDIPSDNVGEIAMVCKILTFTHSRPHPRQLIKL